MDRGRQPITRVSTSVASGYMLRKRLSIVESPLETRLLERRDNGRSRSWLGPENGPKEKGACWLASSSRGSAKTMQLSLS